MRHSDARRIKFGSRTSRPFNHGSKFVQLTESRLKSKLCHVLLLLYPFSSAVVSPTRSLSRTLFLLIESPLPARNSCQIDVQTSLATWTPFIVAFCRLFPGSMFALSFDLFNCTCTIVEVWGRCRDEVNGVTYRSNARIKAIKKIKKTVPNR